MSNKAKNVGPAERRSEGPVPPDGLADHGPDRSAYVAIPWEEINPKTFDDDRDGVLIAELVTYRENFARLMRDHPGQFALIKGDQVVAVFPTLDEALDAGAERFGEEPALIQRIVASEVIHSPGGLTP